MSGVCCCCCCNDCSPGVPVFFFWRDIGEVNWGLSEILWERVRCENLVDCFSFTLGKPAIQSSTSFLAFLPAPELELKWSHNRTPQLSWKYPTVSFKQSHYLTNASHDLFFFLCPSFKGTCVSCVNSETFKKAQVC